MIARVVLEPIVYLDAETGAERDLWRVVAYTDEYPTGRTEDYASLRAAAEALVAMDRKCASSWITSRRFPLDDVP